MRSGGGTVGGSWLMAGECANCGQVIDGGVPVEYSSHIVVVVCDECSNIIYNVRIAQQLDRYIRTLPAPVTQN